MTFQGSRGSTPLLLTPPQKQTCETVLIKQVQYIVMNYLTLAQIKKHLNIDTQFTEDDEYNESLGEVAEEIV